MPAEYVVDANIDAGRTINPSSNYTARIFAGPKMVDAVIGDTTQVLTRQFVQKPEN